MVDHIIVEVPQVKKPDGAPMPFQEVSSINISAGSWPLGIQKVWIYSDDLGLGQQHVPEFNEGSKKAPPQNTFVVQKMLSANQSFSIPVVANRGIKYVMIEVVGNSIKDNPNVYGPNAEGFSIKDISFTIKTPVKGISGVPEKTEQGAYKFTAIGSGSISGKTNITSGDFGVFKLSSVSESNAYSGSTIDEVRLNSLTIESELKDKENKSILDSSGKPVKINFVQALANPVVYNSATPFNNKTISFTKDSVTYTIEALSQTTGLSSISPSIYQVNRSGGSKPATSLSNSEINSQFSVLRNMAPIYQVVTTNGVELESIESSIETDVVNFYVADADISGLKNKQNKKLSINAKDGAVVLSDEIGNPIGFPDYSKFSQPIDNSTGVGVEVSFGNTILKWDLKDSNGIAMPAPDGLQFGFYNIKTRQFLGKKFSYQYYTRNKRDIYIGLIAFDADRNLVTTDNLIGIENRTSTLREFQFPAKSICPVYSVIVSDRPKIGISGPPKDLSKFDSWFINLSRGQFFKTITIPSGRVYTDWKKNYYGQSLRCFYDTTKIAMPSAAIFGSGYYDVMEENPIVISRNAIQLRHGSFHVTQDILDKPNINTVYTDASPIKAWVNIFIRDKHGKWFEVNDNQIRNYSKHSGIIYMEREIVPTNEEDIKVNYVLENSNLMLSQVGGREIPLNPYVASTGKAYGTNTPLDYSKKNLPIHFFIVPSTVEVLRNGEWENVVGYVPPKNVFDFTTDYSSLNVDSDRHDPLALYLGAANVNTSYDVKKVAFSDLRLKGGGVGNLGDAKKIIDEKPNILNFSDLYSGKGYLYPAGGYVIVKIPIEVKNNFNSPEEVYSVVRSNLTAGVAFDIQDMDGNDWRTTQ